MEFEIKGLETVRANLSRDIALLSQRNPDPDIVEDIARDVLGLVRPGERVMIAH